MPYEGSVDIDGEGYSEENIDDESTVTEDDQDIENSSTSEEVEKPVEGEEVVPEEQPKAPELTEKGTKLAEDPLQRANQLRANAEKKVEDYENLLMDPDQLERYVQDLKASRGDDGKHTTIEASPEAKQILQVDPDKIETVEDLRNFAKAVQQTLEEEVGSIKKTVGGIVEGQKTEKMAQKVSSDIDAVRAKYPELRDKNPDGSPNPSFNPTFDEKLGKLYESLDFDPKTKMFRGQVNIVDLADTLADMMNVGKTKGSTEAQTIIKDKRVGRTSSGSVTAPSDVDEKDMTPSQIIASRIKRSRASSRR